MAMPPAENPLRRRLTWFLLLRMGITTGLLGAATFLFLRDGGTEVESGMRVLVAIGALYFVSLISGLLLPRVHNLVAFSYAQMTLDTLFVGGIIVLTGGLNSPFHFLYPLAILNAAFLLARRGAVVAASLAALCHGVTADLSYYGLIPFSQSNAPAVLLASSITNSEIATRLVISLFSFYAVALLGSYLTQRLLRVETLLAERDVAFGRLSSLYQGVVQNLENGTLITNAGGGIEYANAPASEIVGLPQTALFGKTVGDLFPQLDLGNVNGKPIEFSLSIGGNDHGRTLRMTRAPLCDTYGNSIGTLYSVQDVTSIKALELSLKAAQELERAGEPTDLEGLETFAGLVGRSEGMNRVYQLIRKIAESTSTVLIMGESGTGKELVAQAIHEQGPRALRPFVAVNCGAIPESLIESELFGHVKGAFTGAVKDRAGLFREADGGTIFLDEIGELPLQLQVKLLRVLQEREATPVGGSKSFRIDVRVVAATNRNLETEVAAGRFREDLFYRLNVISVPLPPLRERAGDLPLLIHHFLKRFAAGDEKSVRQVSPRAMRTLLDYSYPGNVRELENIIQHAVTMAEEETIRNHDLPAHLRQAESIAGGIPPAPLPPDFRPDGNQGDFFDKGVGLDAELEAYEQRLLRAALERTGGVQKKAAEVLGINYRSLRHRLQKYHLTSLSSS